MEKDGKRLTICWLTYPSRQELPLLAESAQASLKKIGIEVQIQCTANQSGTAEKRKLGCLCQRICQRTDGRSRVFLYNALPAGFLQNRGGYYSETLEMLEQQLSGEFDTEND